MTVTYERLQVQNEKEVIDSFIETAYLKYHTSICMDFNEKRIFKQLHEIL